MTVSQRLNYDMIIVDMESTRPTFSPSILKSPEIAREERDRALAIEYVRRGENKETVSEICKDTGINYRMVYRARDKYLRWARKQVRLEVAEQLRKEKRPA